MEEFDSSLRIYYTPLDTLGKGAFGTVWKCSNNSNNQIQAVKILKIHKKSPKQINSLLFEAQLLEKLNNEHIVKFMGTRCTDKFICIETELLNGGTLKSRLTRRLSEAEVVMVMKGLLSGVAYLHSKNIVHRDIKPDNILFADSSYTSLKITDFGLSGQLQSESSLEDTCGTTLYMAPEQAQLRFYSEAVDVWSCGIIFYIMLVGKHPLYSQGDDTKSYFKKLVNPKWKIPEDFPILARDLFEHMVRFNPVNRYTAETALKHPWITGNSNAAIPMTYYEKIRLFQSTTLLNKIFSSAFFLGALRPRTSGYTKIYKDFVMKVDKEVKLELSSPQSEFESSFATVRTQPPKTRSNWTNRLTLNLVDDPAPKYKIKPIPSIIYSQVSSSRMTPSNQNPRRIPNGWMRGYQQSSPQKLLDRSRRGSLNPQSRNSQRIATIPSNPDISKIYSQRNTKRTVSVLQQRKKPN
jgi:serine/threonine protein kinase